nr:MAG TPA: hypothetical protein [Bacteriophage sp.]
MNTQNKNLTFILYEQREFKFKPNLGIYLILL